MTTFVHNSPKAGNREIQWKLRLGLHLWFDPSANPAIKGTQVGGQHLIYDALTMPVADPQMVSVGLFTSVAFAALAAASWFRLRGRPAHQSEDRSKALMVCSLATLVTLGAVGVLIYFGVATLLWRHDYAHHDFAVLDGCVAGFSERVHTDHDLGVDDFTLQGRPFTLSDSGWKLGYHVSHHHSSPIEDGLHLRAFAHGQRLLRIEFVPASCPE